MLLLVIYSQNILSLCIVNSCVFKEGISMYEYEEKNLSKFFPH